MNALTDGSDVETLLINLDKVPLNVLLVLKDSALSREIGRLKEPRMANADAESWIANFSNRI